MSGYAAIKLPAFPHGVTVEADGYSAAGDRWVDMLAYRANGTREIANLTVYPDGRVMARKSHRARGPLDAAAWAGIVRALGGTDYDHYAGVVMPGNPVT